MAADSRARVFVIFLDTLHTTIEGSASMRTPLVRFIDRLMGPDDLVAVMTPEMAASDITFGRKTTVISNIMQREWTWGRRERLYTPDPKEDLYNRCFADKPAIAKEMIARRREKLSLDALGDLVTFLQGVRDERKAILRSVKGGFCTGRLGPWTRDRVTRRRCQRLSGRCVGLPETRNLATGEPSAVRMRSRSPCVV